MEVGKGGGVCPETAHQHPRRGYSEWRGSLMGQSGACHGMRPLCPAQSGRESGGEGYWPPPPSKPLAIAIAKKAPLPTSVG